MTRSDLLRLVARIQTGDFATEDEADALVDEFDRAVPHPEAGDLIFWPRRHGFDHEPTAEEVVDAALAYRAIELGPAAE